MEYPRIKTLTAANIAQEHIWCGFADKKNVNGYNAKKEWLTNQFKDGYTFKKLDVLGKVFIEYVPAEKAWAPIDANYYMLINCFCVSGKYKGKGYGNDLYGECLKDSKDQNLDGIVIITGNSKKPYMSEKKFFQKKGFLLSDTTDPYFELWYKPLKKSAQIPQFKQCVKNPSCASNQGLEVYYTNACPFSEYYVKTSLANIARERNIPLAINKIDTREKAQKHCIPHTMHSVFYNGEFITHQLLTEKLFGKFLNSKITK